MFAQLRTSLLILLVFTILTGFVYPLAITTVSLGFFNRQSEGSLIIHEGKTLGSDLIGQPFDAPKYFWSRPSATTPYPYNAASSVGSNFAIGTPDQLAAVAQRVANLRQADPTNQEQIPIDLVTASGSGLDPDISTAAARYQINRVAKARGLNTKDVEHLVQQFTEGRQWGVLGEPRVNVLRLNLALDFPGQMGSPRSWKDAL